MNDEQPNVGSSEASAKSELTDDPHRREKLLPFKGANPDPVLGIFDDAQYHISSCNLSAGDILLRFTDGLFEVEATGAQYYDQSGLLRAINQRAALALKNFLGNWSVKSSNSPGKQTLQMRSA